MRARRLPLVLAFALLPGLLPGALFGQEHPRQPLLKLVPADFGFTLVVQDLRDQLERWGKSEWLKKMEETPLVQLVLKSDELRDLRKMLDDLPTYVGVDWPTLRDEVLGDAIVLAYRPPPPDKPKEENGLLLLRARRPELLGKIMSRLNELQKKSGELKDLEALEHRGVKYWRRVHEKNSHYYALKDGLLIVAASDELMRQLLDSTLKEPGENLWSRAIAKAAVPRSFVSLAVTERLIKVRFDHPLGRCLELSEKLRGAYGLSSCEVVPADPASNSDTLGIAEAAAAEMEKYLVSQHPVIVALGTGRTLRACC